MNFDLYLPFQNKEGKYCPGIKPQRMSWAKVKEVMSRQGVANILESVRSGHKEEKVKLPAICWTGLCKEGGTRSAANMIPTQLVMVDIDHIEGDVRLVWDDLFRKMSTIRLSGGKSTDNRLIDIVLVAHVTPSGHGLRIVFRAWEDYPRLIDHMNWFNEQLDLGSYGDFDTAVKDFSRISFLVSVNDILYEGCMIDHEETAIFEFSPLKGDVEQGEEKVTKPLKNKQSEGSLFDNTSVPPFTDEEKVEFDNFDYRGVTVKVIVEKYVSVYGQPSSGEIHNYYNEMVKNFRCICSNNKRLLLYLLPRFGHTTDECWSQIVSICRVNTLSRLPKDFYFFLKDNGFYEPRQRGGDDLKSFLLNESESDFDMPPYLPPVFRELVGTAPKDFVMPAIDALLPILGTLTSYLQAEYPYDGRMHTTSFFSVIYAPPGTGKGFVERFINLLFEDLKLRDYVQSARENVYLRAINKKGANDKAPDEPHTSLRIIPPKNSEAEFLQKQADNKGYHMFTYAQEMDSWAKGVRAAGGNKDDMIRIAWDNGEYGQQFKSANTFKGMVNLYWNVLITGSVDQLYSYFKNVENGLVTRCSFAPIENQEFAAPPVWRKLSKRGLEVIKAFTKRCDERTYETPCEISVTDLQMVSDQDFDKEVDWRFKFRERRTVDMSWLMPVINEFHKKQMELAALDVDRARDVFRRRVGVRGFRLGLLCMGLWESPRKQDLEKCKEFIKWFMQHDLENILKLWGEKYNSLHDDVVCIKQRSVFSSLDDKFTRSDVYSVCVKQGIKTPVRRVIFDWVKLGVVKKLDKDNFEKVKRNEKK